MSKNIKTPPSLEKCTSYETWLKEIEIWQTFTDLDPKKQGAAIFLTLEGQAREAVLELEVAKISATDGVKQIINKLDSLFLKDKTQSAFEAYDCFEKFRRPAEMSMSDYINEFERLKSKIESYKMSLSTDVMAYRLLKSANLSETHEQLAKATIPELTYDAMKTQLRKIFGDVSQSKTERCDLGAVKAEPSFYQSSNRGYNYEKSKKKQFRPWDKNKKFSTNRNQVRSKQSIKGRNPLDKNGEVSRCDMCDSINHWRSNCPDAIYYNSDRSDTSEDSPDETHKITLFQSSLVMNDQFNVFVTETLNNAVLDSGATANVAGKMWTKCYLDSLSKDDRAKVTHSDSNRSFKFGSDHTFNSLHKVRFPATIGSKKIFIETDVIDTTLPLLLSKKAMKSADTQMNFVDDTVVMFGEKQDVVLTRSGHYSVPLDNKKRILEDAASNTSRIILHVAETDSKDKNKIASKLHSQFAHPSPEKLVKLVASAGMGNDIELIRAIKYISKKCDVCASYRKSAIKPIVSMPLANDFNEVVALDLKFYKGKIVLHLIDHLSRFSAAAVVKSKKPNEIIAKVFQCWISIFGPPKRFLHDNGGEFVNSEFLELCESFNIVVLTTAAESPWSNGLCERHNAVLADMLDKIIEERQCDLETAICWAVHAKNSLSNVHGFSPYQIAIGLTPKLPCVLDNSPPALEEPSNSIVLRNLKAIESSRKAFIEAESKEKIKRALKHNLRTSNDQKFISGDIVYYKRNDARKWKGPAKVLGTDSQQVLLKHGGIYVRVHKCRLMRIKDSNEQVQKEDLQDEEDSDEETNSRKFDMSSDSESEMSENPNPHVEASSETEDDHDESFQDCTVQSPRPEQCLETQNEVDEQVLGAETLKLKKGLHIQYRNAEYSDWKTAKVVSRAGKVGGKYQNHWNIDDGEKICEINTDIAEWKLLETKETTSKTDTEISLCQTYVSEIDRTTEEAKSRELDSWIREDVYKEVEDVGQDSISVRWVITPKLVNEVMTTKARLVARGFQENVDDLRTDSPTCMRESLRLLLAISSSKEWSINSIDIKVAFLQGKKIDRTIFLKPPKEAKSVGKLWKLKKAVYGLSDASRVWYLRVVDEVSKLGATISRYDKAFFNWKKDGILQGMMAVHVDDFIWCGTSDFEKCIIDPIRATFKISKEHKKVFRYLGVDLQQRPGMVQLDQNSYVDSIQPITLPNGVENNAEIDADMQTSYKGLVGQISWASGTSRPDMSFESCILSTYQSKPTFKSVFEANKALRDLKANRQALKFPKLNISTARIAVFCDASYGNLQDGSS